MEVKDIKDIKEKNITCTNCGKKNHDYKECRDPITSYGVILVRLSENNDLLKKYIDDLCKNKFKIELNEYGIRANNIKDIENFSKYKDSIKFLMIQRKHTLGFIEFIRGRYKIDNIDGIIYLFQQMTSEEIKKIAETTDFHKLWTDFWGNDNFENPNFHNEFVKSKEKFLTLKNNDDEYSLDFYTKNVVPAWNSPEWGFPKGRKNKYEDNLNCAKREFEEESDLTNEDYEIVENITPIIEDFIGTNGIKYRHVYYIGLSKNNNNLNLNLNNSHQKNEIGSIGFFNYDDSIKNIRPYHVTRKKVLTKLYMFILDCFIKFS